MKIANASANLNAAIEVAPLKSQVFLVALLILSAICFLAGFIFLWYKPSLAWVPISLGVLVLGISAGMVPFAKGCRFRSVGSYPFYG